MPQIQVDDADNQLHTADEQQADSYRSNRAGKNRSRMLMWVIFGVVVVTVAVCIGVLLRDRSNLKKEVGKLSQSQQQNPEAEAARLTNEVAKLIELPTNETPTIATVTDASKVKDKPFFANAQNGDKVLVFAKSGKAILYRPTTHKLVEVSAVNSSGTQPTTDTQGTSTTTR